MAMSYEDNKAEYLRAEARGNATNIIKAMAKKYLDRHIEKLTKTTRK